MKVNPETTQKNVSVTSTIDLEMLTDVTDSKAWIGEEEKHRVEVNEAKTLKEKFKVSAEHVDLKLSRDGSRLYLLIKPKEKDHQHLRTYSAIDLKQLHDQEQLSGGNFENKLHLSAD